MVNSAFQTVQRQLRSVRRFFVEGVKGMPLALLATL
jgi:hypothetical protein